MLNIWKQFLFQFLEIIKIIVITEDEPVLCPIPGEADTTSSANQSNPIKVDYHVEDP
jgi:hypothetical protein